MVCYAVDPSSDLLEPGSSAFLLIGMADALGYQLASPISQ